jgi:hypothetical protein
MPYEKRRTVLKTASFTVGVRVEVVMGELSVFMVLKGAPSLAHLLLA